MLNLVFPVSYSFSEGYPEVTCCVNIQETERGAVPRSKIGAMLAQGVKD